MLGNYKNQGKLVKPRKIDIGKPRKDLRGPLRGVNFDTICSCPRLF